MDNSNSGAPSNDPIRELFGSPPPRRPIPSNSFNALVKIFSLFSDQNPFSEYASYAKLPEFPRQCGDNLNDSRRLSSDDLCSDVEHVVVPRVEKEASNTLAGSDTVEAHNLPVHDHEANKEGVPGEFCKDIGFSGSKLINELGRTDKSKTMEKLPSAEEGTSTGMAEVDKVHEELSGIERILMDESDDFSVLQLSDKNVNSNILNEFGCLLDTDVFVKNSVIAESSNSAKVTVDGNMKGDGAEEKKRKHVEVSTSTSGGDEAKSHTHLSVVREVDCREVGIQHVGMCPGEAQMPLEKQRKAPQGLSEDLTFAAPKSNNIGGTISNSIKMGNKSSAVIKGKIKKVKKISAKDVNSGKSKILSIDSGTSYNMSSGGVDPIVCEKMVKQSVYGNIGKSTARKMTSVPEDVLKIVQEIDAEVHSKYQDSAAGIMTDAGSAKKKNPGPPTENKMAEEEIPAKEVAETSAGVSNFGTTIPDQLDKSNSKQQLDANASFSSGVATPKNLKENIATQASLPGKAPKGLSFLSSGKSSLKDSGKLKELDLSQKSGSATGTSSQPNIATTAVNVVKYLIDTPALDTQGKDFISFLRHSAGSSGDKKQANPSHHRDNSRFYSFGQSENVNPSHKSDDPSATSNQLNKGMSSRVLSVCEMPEANPASISPKQISIPSSGGFAYDNCAAKSQATLPNNGHLDSQIRENESANGSDKAVQPKLWGSPASSGQSPIKVGVKNTPGTAQRALLSTLSFAAKYGSGIKMTSASSAKEVTKNEKTSSGSGCTQDEPSKASAILDFLYSGSNKEKQ
uniref:Uncharacterized protein n=1 Tax=Chenopodium quinoa TaxID=63459 RepID=A0A803MGE4_CHEQI